MGRTRVVLLAFVVALVCGLWSAGAARAQEPGTLENVLVFSKTGGFRHDSIPQGITAIQQLGTANGFTVTATEDATAFTDANLANFDVVVFLSTTGEVLDDDAAGGVRALHPVRRRLRRHPRRVRHGVLVALVRRAGRRLLPHPPRRDARPRRSRSRTPTSPRRPACRRPGRAWTSGTTSRTPPTPAVNGSGTIADYSPRARHVKVLATVDESTYGEEDGNTADDDHPVAWCSNFDGGISWYTAMGHTQASFADADVPRPPARRPAAPPPASPATAASRARCRPSPRTSRRSRSTTTRRRRWRSRSPRTAACSTSSSASRSPAARPTRPPPS